MEPSSGQNSSRNGNHSQEQTSSEDENRDKDDPVAPEQTTGNKTSNEEGRESTVAPSTGSHPDTGNIEQNATNSETDADMSPERSTAHAGAFGILPKGLPVVLTYAARNRPRQPFYGDAPPPSTSRGQQQQPTRQRVEQSFESQQRPVQDPPPRVVIFTPDTQDTPLGPATATATGPGPISVPPIIRQPSSPREELKIKRQYLSSDAVSPLSNPIINPFTNIVIWAPYPAKIPEDVPPQLSHLIDAEVVFVVQHLEAIEFFASLDLPNIYFIQNTKGECIYYVYESTLCIPCCCKNSRALQLHVMDMYQDEVIFMKKSCGCALYFCCFPLLEVYSPPSVPLGAVVKQCHPSREQFNILDADENLMFKLYGDCSLMYCSRCIQYDFSIRALDGTEVGFIRRDFPGMYQFLMGTEYYGVSFPQQMDVRLKAVFLGALFLIDFLYFN